MTMQETPCLKPEKSGMGFWKSLLLTIPMSLLIAMMVAQGVKNPTPIKITAIGTVWAGLSAIFFFMLHTGKTHKFRAPLFVAMAVTMSIWFIAEIVAHRGSNVVSELEVIQGDVPFCHLVIPAIVIPAITTQTVIFPGSMDKGFAAIPAMIGIWLGATIILGRGWCSWVCFYGGWDEGCSKILKKPVIKKVSRKWTLMPWAVLLFVVLTSAALLEPTYCEWLCPFKTVTEYGKVDSIKAFIQTVIFVGLFVGLVIILPLLTRKRTQCSWLCPLGAIQGATNKLVVFDVRIDKSKCHECGKCVRECATFSLDEQSVKEGKTLMSCVKCGHCVDSCPTKAIDFHLKGTPVGTGKNAARVLFLYPAFLFFSAFGGGFFVTTITMILNLVVHGRLS